MNKHTATLPDGTIVKRGSQNRTYSHVIAQGPMPKGLVVSRLEATRDSHRQYLAKYRAILDYVEAGRPIVPVTLSWGSTVLDLVELPWDLRDRQLFAIDADEIEATYAEFVISTTRALGKVIEQIEAAIEGPELVGSWGAIGWAGRPDLAEKAAQTARNRNPFQQVVVIEAVHA